MGVRQRRYAEEQVRLAVATSTTMAEVLRKLGIVPRGGNYESVRRHMDELRLGFSGRALRGRPLRSCSDEEIADAVRRSRSVAAVMRQLHIRPGGNQGRLASRILELGLDTSHMLGAAWRRGAHDPVRPAEPLAALLVEGRPHQSNRLKHRLIAEGLKERRCEMCGGVSWNGRPTPLELDHVNGRRDDNRLENLRILCPNCHAQTDTYRGRNIGMSGR